MERLWIYFGFGQCSSNPRTSPAIHVHQGSSTQMREHLHTQHHVFNHQRQHHANGPNLASPLVSVTRRGLPPPPPPMPDQNGGFFIYPPPSSSGGHREPETDQFHPWERDWFPHFPVPSNHRTISSFWHRHFWEKLSDYTLRSRLEEFYQAYEQCIKQNWGLVWSIKTCLWCNYNWFPMYIVSFPRTIC